MNKFWEVEVRDERKMFTSTYRIHSFDEIKKKLEEHFDSKYVCIILHTKVAVNTDWGLSIHEVTFENVEELFKRISSYFSETSISEPFISLSYQEEKKPSKTILSKIIKIKEIEHE